MLFTHQCRYKLTLPLIIVAFYGTYCMYITTTPSSIKYYCFQLNSVSNSKHFYFLVTASLNQSCNKDSSNLLGEGAGYWIVDFVDTFRLVNPQIYTAWNFVHNSKYKIHFFFKILNSLGIPLFHQKAELHRFCQ